MRWLGLAVILVATRVAAADPDPAWQAYDDAFAKAAAGDREGARQGLVELMARWPAHPATQRANEVIADLAPRAPSKISKVARGELAFWSTVGGVFLGANLCVIADCGDERTTAAVYTGAVAGSLAVSLVASRRGVEAGEASLYNSAQTWGSWNGLGLNDDFAQDSEQAAVALGAQGTGLAAGVALWNTKAWQPTQGDVALTNTFFIWSTVLTVFGGIAADSELTLRRVVIAGDLGLVFGAVASRTVKMSRGRTLLIDVGGVLGILGGGLVAVGSDNERTAGGALFVGTALGLGLATVATRDWDLPDPPKLTLSPAPLRTPSGNTALGVQAGFRF